jgi:hypothetical protein
MSLWQPFSYPTRLLERVLVNPIARKVVEMSRPQPPATTTQEVPDYDYQGTRQWRTPQIQMDLISAKRDCWEMYSNDGDVSSGIDGIGEDAATSDNEGYPFRLVPKRQIREPFVIDKQTGLRSASAEARAVSEVYQRIEDKLEQIGLFERLAESFAMALCQGDHFDEVIWDLEKGEALRLEPIPGIDEGCMMRPLIDPETRVRVAWGLFDVDTGERLRELHDFQVFGLMRRRRRPLLTSSRLQWKMLHENEEDLYGARKTRAYSRTNVVVQGASPQELKEMQREADKVKRQNGIGVDSDLYSNAAAVLLDPMNPQLSNVSDLEYRRSQLTNDLRKPKGLQAAGGKDINRATLDRQDKGYNRFLTRVNTMAHRPIRNLVRTQLLLWGYAPDDYPFAIKWTERNEENWKETVEAATGLSALGVSLPSIQSELGFDFEEEVRQNEYARSVMPAEDAVSDRMVSELFDRVRKRLGGSGAAGEGSGNSVATR